MCNAALWASRHSLVIDTIISVVHRDTIFDNSGLVYKCSHSASMFCSLLVALVPHVISITRLRSLTITISSFRYTSPCLWNQLPVSFHQLYSNQFHSHSSHFSSHVSLSSLLLTFSFSLQFSSGSKLAFSTNPIPTTDYCGTQFTGLPAITDSRLYFIGNGNKPSVVESMLYFLNFFRLYDYKLQITTCWTTVRRRFCHSVGY